MYIEIVGGVGAGLWNFRFSIYMVGEPAPTTGGSSILFHLDGFIVVDADFYGFSSQFVGVWNVLEYPAI